MSLLDDLERYARSDPHTTIYSVAVGLEKDYFIVPKTDIAAVEITQIEDRLQAGSGPEGCEARLSENPTWLHNHALSALALAERIRCKQAGRDKEEARLQRKREEIADFYVGVIYKDLTDKDRIMVDRIAEANERIARLEEGQS